MSKLKGGCATVASGVPVLADAFDSYMSTANDKKFWQENNLKQVFK
jgi:hypothetical protein